MPTLAKPRKKKYMLTLGGSWVTAAEDIVKAGGGFVNKGRLFVPEDCENQDVIDAVAYLCDVWGYDLVALTVTED